MTLVKVTVEKKEAEGLVIPALAIFHRLVLNLHAVFAMESVNLDQPDQERIIEPCTRTSEEPLTGCGMQSEDRVGSQLHF